MKKTMMILLAVVLIVAISVAGTLAYLTAESGSVTNTFAAVTGLVENDGLVLTEHVATPVGDGSYELGAETTNANTYNFIPKVNVAKDPYVTVNFTDNATDSYLYITVIDKLDRNVLGYEIDSKNWQDTGLTKDGNKVYVYVKEGVPVKTHTDINDGINILANKQIVVGEFGSDYSTAKENTLSFQAYLCQVGSFTDANAAFTESFGAGAKA